jgi:hypothetical protein
MKASIIIAKLETILEIKGDIDVKVFDLDRSLSSVETVETDPNRDYVVISD